MNPRLVTDAVHTRLSAELDCPVTVGERVDAPAAVVIHPIPGGERPGVLSDLHRSGVLAYQFTVISEVSREQAEWLVEQTIAAVDGWTDDDAGVRLVAVVGWGGVRLAADDPHGVWVATPDVHITVDQPKES